MKVKLNDEVIFEIDETMMKILSYDLDDPVSEIKRRLQYIIEHKCDQSFSRMEKDYMGDLRSDPSTTSIPKDKGALVDAIMSLATYNDKKKRNLQSED